VLQTDRLVGVAGFAGSGRLALGAVELQPGTPSCALWVQSLTDHPIAGSRHLLVTAVAAAAQTGMTFVDGRMLDVVDFGRPPMLRQPVRATIRIRTEAGDAPWHAWLLDASGVRAQEVELQTEERQVILVLDGEHPAQHIEMARGRLPR
jgi:hypothetical protein